MPICKCGKEVADYRGARGHVQFTAGDGHGEKGDVPDGWRDLFTEADDAGQDAVDDAGQDDVDDAGQDDVEAAPDEADGQEAAQAATQAGEDDADEEAGPDAGRLWKALTDDVRHLWRGA